MQIISTWQTDSNLFFQQLASNQHIDRVLTIAATWKAPNMDYI